MRTAFERPKVTIGISTYNRADGYFREAFASALAQDYPHVEIVVCDNASTDGTADLVASAKDGRVRYYRHERNIGPNANFNFAAQQATGSWFLMLHDDDVLDRDFVSTCVAAMEGWDGDPPGLVRTGVRVIDAAGVVTAVRRNEAVGGAVGDLVLDWFARRTPMYFCNTLFRTDTFLATGGFQSPRELYPDVAAVVRLAARHPVVNVPDVVSSFRRHGGNNGSAQSIAAWCEDSRYLLDLMVEHAPERATEIRRLGLRYFSHNNYRRVERFRGVRTRLAAYWIVYRAFGFTTSPVQYLARRRLRRMLRAGHGVG